MHENYANVYDLEIEKEVHQRLQGVPDIARCLKTTSEGPYTGVLQEGVPRKSYRTQPSLTVRAPSLI